MAELDGKQTAAKGLIGLVLLLGGFGGGLFLTEDEFDHAYVCPLNENVGIFHRLSASEKTGYYYDDTGTEKRIACRTGNTYAPWVSLRQYAEDKGLDPLSFIIKHTQDPPQNGEIPPPTEGKKWICSIPPKGCDEA